MNTPQYSAESHTSTQEHSSFRISLEKDTKNSPFETLPENPRI